eukprot:774493_1
MRPNNMSAAVYCPPPLPTTLPAFPVIQQASYVDLNQRNDALKAMQQQYYITDVMCLMFCFVFCFLFSDTFLYMQFLFYFILFHIIFYSIFFLLHILYLILLFMSHRSLYVDFVYLVCFCAIMWVIPFIFLFLVNFLYCFL